MRGRLQDTMRKRCGKFADRRALTVVKEVTSTTYLPSFRSELRRPILHRAHPDDWSRSLCGAPVIGVLVWDEPLECVVCAQLLERKEGN